MQADILNIRTPSVAKGAMAKIGDCLRKGCVICIEHSPSMTPQFTPWELWGRPCCYNGDKQRIFDEIDRCRTAHASHHIRLNIEDHNCYSRFSLLVHRPPGAA